MAFWALARSRGSFLAAPDKSKGLLTIEVALKIQSDLSGLTSTGQRDLLLAGSKGPFL